MSRQSATIRIVIAVGGYLMHSESRFAKGERMQCLKEPLSRLANRQDKARGAFFEGRFKSVAILDDESLLATCAHIDLNPDAAGIAVVPEAREI